MTIDRKIETELSDFYPQGELKALVRLLLWRIAGWSWTDLLTRDDLTLSAEQQRQVNDAVARLKRHEPIQYIFGDTEFCGLRFCVDSRALIPRPETEMLVDLVAKSVSSENPRILDIGTGSGCIAIALAKCLTTAHVSAFDISDSALSLAQENAQLNNVSVDFQQVDILKDVQFETRFDAIVSNPPYVADSERETMSANVLDYEPALALFVPDENPLIFYCRIADFAMLHLAENGQLFFEINHRFADETAELLRKKGFRDVSLYRDSFEKHRFISAKK